MDKQDRARLHAEMVRFARGDRDAFTTVFELLWPALRGFATKLLSDASEIEAEDVAQAALLKIFSRISDYDPNRDGLSWAFGIAAYEVKTFRLRRTRRKEVSEDAIAALAVEDESPAALSETAQLRARLAEAVQFLPAQERALLLGGEPSHVLSPHVAPATMRKRRQRALIRLRSIWRYLNGAP